MQLLRKKLGFTLVEILIVVVILGLLAALVIPAYVNAERESTRSALKQQLLQIRDQIELYRTRVSGLLPTTDPVSPMADGTWGVLVSSNYLKEEPLNMYIGTGTLNAGTQAQAIVALPGSATGWFFESPNATTLNIWAAGLDEANDRLSNE